MKLPLQAAIYVKDRTVIEIDKSITKVAAVKDGMLFAQELTPEGKHLAEAAGSENLDGPAMA